MTTTLFSREIVYGKKDVALLEHASVNVQLIYDKTLHMLHNHLPDFLWEAWIGVPYDIISSLYKGDNDSGSVFQKWIQSPDGWKCIGCERHCLEPGETRDGNKPGAARTFTFHNGIRQSMVLQAMVWSMYENTRLLEPYLGDGAFLDERDMETIAAHFVPTYLHKERLAAANQPIKEYTEKNIRVYQQWISAPDLVLKWNGGLTEGRWMTGVYVDHSRFAGLGPYLKDAAGKRTYMRATVE
ncbi:hypothetical protein [Paenibacillus sp. NFR01]|uniref:hypothetical protein n=1 Tax=Paenibacillus sp. NFR01 TaxID=1566279 RepID=UPI0008AEB900|nr:hypothetical protein [Paenibacillus sp. NFR01]SET59267.1 hypothetical protein SAMN03159358_2118 [Paenibacillus sp. NFR01]